MASISELTNSLASGVVKIRFPFNFFNSNNSGNSNLVFSGTFNPVKSLIFCFIHGKTSLLASSNESKVTLNEESSSIFEAKSEFSFSSLISTES